MNNTLNFGFEPAAAVPVQEMNFGFEPAPPSQDNLEQGLQMEALAKQQKERLQFLGDRLKQAQESDPRRWTMQQTQDYFRNNPAKTVEEEGVRKRLLDSKRDQVRTVSEKIQQMEEGERLLQYVQPGFYEDIGLSRPPTSKEQARMQASLRRREWDLLPPTAKGEWIMSRVSEKALPFLITAPAAGVVWPWMIGYEALSAGKNVAIPLAKGEGAKGLTALEDQHLTDLLGPVLESVPEKGKKLPDVPEAVRMANPTAAMVYDAAKWAEENPRQAFSVGASVGEMVLDYLVVKKGLNVAADLKAIQDPRLEEAFKALGLNPGSTTRDAEAAFRNAALKMHPDRGGNAEEFQRVQEAISTVRSYRDNLVRRVIDFIRGDTPAVRSPMAFLQSQSGQAQLIPEGGLPKPSLPDVKPESIPAIVAQVKQRALDFQNKTDFLRALDGAEPMAAVPSEPIRFLGTTDEQNLENAAASISYEESNDGEPLGYTVTLNDGTVLQNSSSKALGSSPFFSTLDDADAAAKQYLSKAWDEAHGVTQNTLKHKGIIERLDAEVAKIQQHLDEQKAEVAGDMTPAEAKKLISDTPGGQRLEALQAQSGIERANAKAPVEPDMVYRADPIDKKALDAKVTEELDRENKRRILTPDEQFAQKYLKENPEEFTKAYLERVHEEYRADTDNIVSADSAKFAVPGMDSDKSRSYHEAGSAFAKYWFEHLLSDPSTKDMDVIFTAGISGAGKSHFTRAMFGKTYGKFAAIYDTNLSNKKSFMDKMQAIRDYNKKLGGSRTAKIVYVDRDPVEAWIEGVLPRATKQDRVVPEKSHVGNYFSRQAVKEIVADNMDDVSAIFVRNVHNKMELAESLDTPTQKQYTSDELKQAIRAETEKAYANGSINEKIYKTARGDDGGSSPSQPSPDQGRGVSPGGAGSHRELQQDPTLRAESPQGAQGLNPPLPGSVQPPIESPGPAPAGPQDSGKTRKFIRTVRESPNTSAELAGQVEGKYDPISNEQSLEEAKQIIADSPDAATELAHSVHVPHEKLRVANTITILKIRDAQAAGQWDEAKRLVETAAERNTLAGQGIQALAMYNALTPEGVLVFANKVIRAAQGKLNDPEGLKNFFKGIENMSGDEQKKALAKKAGIPYLSDMDAQEIVAMAKRLQSLPDDGPGGLTGMSRERQIATLQLLNKIHSLSPPDVGRKISAIQTMAMLLNPKTIIRNIFGNLGFMAAENLADVVAVPIDWMVSGFTGQRTQYLPSLTAQAKGLVQGAREAHEEIQAGVDLKQFMGKTNTADKWAMPTNGVFDKGVLGALEKTLRYVLMLPDRAFYQAAFNQSLLNQSRAMKVNDVTLDMIEQAHLEGLIRTFQDQNVITKVFSGTKKVLNKIGTGTFGAGDLVIKFPATPSNILKAGIEYSPAGVLKTAKTLYDSMRKKNFQQKAFVRATSRAIVGTALTVGSGAILARLGIIAGRPEKDRDLRVSQYGAGKKGYQVNFSALKRFLMSGMDGEVAAMREGDVLVSYDWAQPMALPIALGADLYLNSQKPLAGKIWDLADKTAEATQTLAEQPLLQGLQRLASSPTHNIFEGFLTAAQSAPASFVPTLLYQIRQLTDNIARNTRDPNYFRGAMYQAANRIPGVASMVVPESINPLGEPREMYQLGSNNPFNVFLNPAFVTRYQPDPVSKMVLDIWENSGNTEQFPRVAQRSIKIGNEQKELTSQEYHDYQQYIGQKTNVLFSILKDDPGFMSLDEDTQAKKLSGFLTDINTAAKIELFGYQPKRISGNTVAVITAIRTSADEIKRNMGRQAVGFQQEDLGFSPESPATPGPGEDIGFVPGR